MSRTASRRHRPRRGAVPSAPRGRSGPWWFAAGLLLGALLAALWLRPEAPVPGTARRAEEQPPPSAAPRPRFDFYTLLEESEVVVPDEDGTPPPPTLPANLAPAPESAPPPPERNPLPSAAAAAQQSAPPSPPSAGSGGESAGGVVYVLQAGSFRRLADADAVRARLLLLNLRASIEKVNTADGQTWHRVLIGPFASPEESARARAVLAQNGIDSLLLKRRR